MRKIMLIRVATLMALLGLGWTAPSAYASVVLDQEYLLSNEFADFTGGGFPGFRRAETFTVGIAGTLSEVDVFTSPSVPFEGFNVLSTAGGTPTTTVLATGTLASEVGGVAAFDVSLSVSVGEVLAIEPITNGLYSWNGNDPGTYPGGGDFVVNPRFGFDSFSPTGVADDFRTFVAIPEPTSMVLLSAGLLSLGLIRLRRSA